MAVGEHDLDAHLQLRTDDRALTATLRVGPKVPMESVSAETFSMFLASRGVTPRAIDAKEVEALAERVRETPGAEHAAIVARGTPPRDGDRQILTWSPRIAAEIERIDRRRAALVAATESKSPTPSEQDGSVNFYEQSAFVVVAAGEVLGVVSPPDPGEDGEDVFGTAVPAKKSPPPANLDPETLSLAPDGRVIALVRGRLLHGAERSIRRTLSIDGDVGFETGNIDFPGPVEISGGVRDRFVVRARGPVTVRKLVEATRIESEREVVLERGAAGRETGSVRAGRGVRSGYLEGVRVECGGDCEVRHEITNCRVRSLGVVRVPSGAIRGGLIAAARGIETGVAGSAREVRTELVVGAVEDLEELLRRSRRQAAETAQMLNEIEKRVDMHKSARGTARPSPEQIEARMAMDFEVEEARRWLGTLSDAARRLEDTLRRARHPALRTMQCIYPGVVLWLPGFRVSFRAEIKGESLIRLDRRNTPVIDSHGQTQPLAKLATVEPDDRVCQIPPEESPDEQDGSLAA